MLRNLKISIDSQLKLIPRLSSPFCPLSLPLSLILSFFSQLIMSGGIEKMELICREKEKYEKKGYIPLFLLPNESQLCHC